MEEFINLHNRTVSRSEVERVISIAKEQNNTEVIYRLSRILNAYPTEQRFVINIKDYPTPPTALAGAHLTGDYREALDENGCLRKGYKFVYGKIIPPQPSHLSDDELTFLAAAGIDYFEEAPDDEAKGLGKPIPAADIYQMITDKIIKMLKSTKASDYKKTWEDDAFFIPLNFDSKKPYRGVNRMLLQERIGLTEAFANPYFLTFKQIKKHKGTLKKGAKGYEVVYYSIRYVVPADKNSGRKAYSSTNAHKVIDFLDKHKLPENIVTRIPMIRYYNVYNGEDITGIDFKLPEVKIGRAIPETASENEAAQLIVENYPNPPAIKHGGNEAYYKLSEDLVRMPKIEQFDSVNDYYRTLFHELTHSTRHENRLNREKNSFRFGDTGYAKEELVAEFGAVFLSAWAGIMWYNNKNHAVYLKNWNSAIKEAENDNKFLMKAASLAQAATDYILNLDAAGQPAFLSKYEKPNKAEKPKKKASASKIQIIPPYPIDIESNEENDDYMQLEKELSDLMGDKFEVWANNLIEQKRKARLAERSKEIKANIDTLKNKEKGATAYEYVRNEYGYNYKVDKKDTKKYEVTLTIYRYGSFNPNENYYDTFKTPEECSAFIIKTLDEQDGFYYSNWYGLSELQNKINELKGYQYSKQFHYQEEEKKAEKPKPEAKKATEKADNTDKKYKFIAFYNSYGRINGIYSYQNLTINEFYLKNTFDDGIKVYAPLKSLEKIEEAKRIIEEQYIEGKDFICLKFESKKRKEYYSLLIHSNEKPKKKDEKPSAKITIALKFSDVEANRQMIEGYRNSSTGKINLLKTDMIGTQFHLSMFEKYMAIDDIAALYGKGRKEEAQKDYAFVKERIESAFNHHLRAAKEYNTIEQCTERFIELLPDLLAKGGQWLEAKARNKNAATAKGKFTKAYKQIFDEIASIAVGANGNSSSKENTPKKAPRAAKYTGVKTIPLSDLYTDEKRFQNRKKLNEEIVENIVKNFKPTDLDPLVVWYDKKQGKTFVLAGHHRFEALKRLKHKNVPVKFANDDYPTEADAIRYAKEISNANRTLEEPYERAAIYRKYREEGYSEKEINDKAALEGKNRSYILNLSCLNPKGATMSTLVQFSQTQSKADKNEAERVADWIGQARRNAPELTDAHEKEMFDFLMNKEASKRTTTKVKFLEYVRACWNPFEPTAPLNLARMKYQSEGEKQYDEEVERYKTLISDLQNNIGNLKDRFINPANKDFVNPEAPDYMAVKKIADNKIAEYNTQIQYYQKELLKLYSNKQSYLKPTGQIALFGSLPIFKTLKEAKKYFKAWAYTHLRGKKVFHKELDKYVVFSSKGIDHVLSSKISLKKMYLIQQAEEMLKNSHLIAFVEDYKKRDNIKGAYRMRTTATFEGEEVKVILTLREGENGVVYYDHKIEEIEESTTPPRKSRANPFCGDSAPTNIPAKTVPNSLNAPRHAGILKEALTEKGKLKKGWYFQDYGIIDPKGKYHPLERDYSLEYNLIEKELRDRAFQQDEKRKIKGFEENKKLEEAIKVYLKELSKENRKHFKNSKAMEVFYWAFPFTLESNSTFYTFEESNPYINKRLQELDQYFTDNNELFERLENYKTLRRYNLKSLGLHISAKISSFIDKQGKVIRGDSNKLNQKYGLSTPITTPNVYVEHLPEETNRQISTSANTLDAKMAALQHRQWETFVIANPQMQAFLGDVERKPAESTVITIAGGAGSGKTRFAFQFINALAQNYKVGHASLEEHPDSKLYYDKVQQYIDETALPNIEAPEIKNLDQLEALIQRNEVIVIDSFAKLQELNPRFLLDRDLRKKYDGKLFLLIYQLTGEGKMRGGSKSEFDGDIILLTHVAPDYRENYIYPSKNRYNALPATQLRYSTYFQQMLDIPKELGTGSRPPEAISLPPAPQTNVYEVIY